MRSVIWMAWKVNKWIAWFDIYILWRIHIWYQLDRNSNCPAIIIRSQWGAQNPACIHYQIFPLSHVIIMATMMNSNCNNYADCRLFMQNIQRFFINEANMCDIPYTWVFWAIYILIPMVPGCGKKPKRLR